MRFAVLAPFSVAPEMQGRPDLVAEVLSDFGDVDLYTTDYSHVTRSLRPPALQEGNIRTILIPTPRYASNRSVDRAWSHYVFTKRALKLYLENRDRYDYVYATAPLNALALGAFRQSPDQIKILDVVDIWPDVLPFSSTLRRVMWPVMRLWRSAFNRAVGKADILMAVSDDFLESAKKSFQRPDWASHRFYLGSRRLPMNGVARESKLTIAYVGNLGHLYDFETLLDAMDRPELRDRIQLFVVGDGDRREWLEEQLKARGIAHRFFGRVYDGYKLGNILGRCHIGFNGYSDTSASFSYKASTYLAAGLPLLNSMCGDLFDLVSEHEIGFNYESGDAEGMAAILAGIDQSMMPLMAEKVKRVFDQHLEQCQVRRQLHQFVREAVLPARFIFG